MFQTRQASMAVAESNLSQQTADEYCDSILAHMVRIDHETRPDAAMIDQQPEINWNWWPILVNMMIDMHERLRLEPATLYLAMNIVNRYCARRIVYQKHFRLVGVTALWIASKYEDKKTSVPTLRLLSHMADDTYPEKLFILMESHMLNTLDWSISHCTVDSFLRVILSKCNPSPLLLSLTSYISEITLYHRVFVGRDPLMIARAIHFLALHLLNMNMPVPSDESSRKWQQWVPILVDIILSPPQVVFEKYQCPEHLAVARVVDVWVLRRQRQAQEEAAAQARAQAKSEAQQQLHLNPLSRQASSSSLPMTPPPSASRGPMASDNSGSIAAQPISTHQQQQYPLQHNGYSGADFTPPSSATIGSYSDQDPYNESPLTIHSLASLTSLSSVTSLNSVTSIAPHQLGLIGSVSQSPPVTPLNPPKPCFRV